MATEKTNRFSVDCNQIDVVLPGEIREVEFFKACRAEFFVLKTADAIVHER